MRRLMGTIFMALFSPSVFIAPRDEAADLFVQMYDKKETARKGLGKNLVRIEARKVPWFEFHQRSASWGDREAARVAERRSGQWPSSSSRPDQ
jgi:hypothetical protein